MKTWLRRPNGISPTARFPKRPSRGHRDRCLAKLPEGEFDLSAMPPSSRTQADNCSPAIDRWLRASIGPDSASSAAPIPSDRRMILHRSRGRRPALPELEGRNQDGKFFTGVLVRTNLDESST